ncbi:MAG: cytochrome c oxidase subunit II [Parcubacteria group bacterium Gr01-1014_13]|nr:MAG: cytochrome c oxidase subunit II [Parcubacteria group bacterium Gr01-1014_13]
MRKKTTFFPAIALGAIVLLGAGCSKPSPSAMGTPSISVSNQSLGDNNQLTIKTASTDQESWIAIHQKENGQLGPVIGYTSLSVGAASKIKITIDRTKVSPTLIAVLRYDRGQKGTFEPDVDGPVIKNRQVIMQEFNITNHADFTKEESVKAAGLRTEFIITAKQWSFSPSVIKVKKGDTVVLKLTSSDVKHSISIPDFGITAEIKPKETKTIEFVADKVGTFKFICGMPCGVGHMGMTGTIVVE